MMRVLFRYLRVMPAILFWFSNRLKALRRVTASKTKFAGVGLSAFLFCFPVQGATLSLTNVPPAPLREFRAAWIATVANIDWPSKPGLTTAEQQAELRAILDRAADLRLNAVIFQVRPACDALYASRIEPWSEYITGKMGKAPAPYYDPLEFAVKEAHARGLELHAWFNPYRARHLQAKSPVAPNHISKTKPQLVRNYGRYLWLDPSEKATREYVLSVILDVVKRYDIDGVHLDDYFYPYKEKDAAQNFIEFPDQKNWSKYRASGGKLTQSDWRRQNVNLLVEQLYSKIKSEKPRVKFGISPFGIWRPGFPQQVTGLDAYEQLYADSRLWMAKGWADYFSPQLYWPIRSPGQSFPTLLNWWAGENAKHRHLWPGIASARINKELPAQEIASEIEITRKQSGGHILWNAGSLMRNQGGVTDLLQHSVYKEQALVPASPWLDKSPPGKPGLAFKSEEGRWSAQWNPTGSEAVWLWVLQKRRGTNWTTEIRPGAELKLASRKGEAPPETLAITAIDRTGNASITSVLPITPAPMAKQVASTGPNRPTKLTTNEH